MNETEHMVQEAEATNQTRETAGPDVVDDSPGTDIVVPETNVDGLKDLAEQLSKMHHRLHKVVYNLTTTAGDKQARRDRKDLVSTRTALTARVADLKRELRAAVATQIERIEDDGGRLLAFVKRYEEPLDAMILADEQRRAQERQQREDAERERLAGHRDRINDISAVATRAVGMTSAEIQKRIEMVRAIVIGPEFEEFEAVGVNTKAETLEKLSALYSNTVDAEAREAQAQRDREELARLQQAERDRQQAEAEQRAKQQRVEAEQRRAADEQRAAQQKAEDARRAQSDAANNLVEEIRRIQRRAITASSTGMLELLTLVENIRPGDELGDFVGVVLKAKDDAIADLHELHEQKLEQERQRVAQEKQQRLADDNVRQMREAQERNAMIMSQIEAIDHQSTIARIGRAPYYTGGNSADVEKIIAETEAWVIDETNFGNMQSVAQNVKAAVLLDLRDYLAVLKTAEADAAREAEIRREQESSEGPSDATGPVGEPLQQFESVQISSAEAESLELTPAPTHDEVVDRVFRVPGDHQISGELPAELDADMTCVPILAAFDQKEPIGQLQILTKHLPPTPDFVFALGFTGDCSGEPGTVPTVRPDGKYKLFAVSPIADVNYLGYLQQIGVLPAGDGYLLDVGVDPRAAAMDALLAAVVDTVKAAKRKAVKHWTVPAEQMALLQSALRAVPLSGGGYYSEDGTLMTADGNRSVFDDVEK